MKLDILKPEHEEFTGWIAANFRRRGPTSIQVVYRMNAEGTRHVTPSHQVSRLAQLPDKEISEKLRKWVERHNKKHGAKLPKKKPSDKTGKRKRNYTPTKRYNRPSSRYSNEPSKNFFKNSHDKMGHYVTWAEAFDRGNSYVSVMYRIKGDKKDHRSPRAKTAWLDNHDLEFAKLTVQKWKKANNCSIGLEHEVPAFYLNHQREYVKWLYNTARHSTIESYNADLIRFVFPFFVGRLELGTPQKWDDDAIHRWEAFLSTHVKNTDSRNKKRTSFRRYLRFLKQTGRLKRIPEILNEPVGKKKLKETPLPGKLPDWKAVCDWIRRLEPGRFRFITAIGAAFGTRVSESYAIMECDFFGAESEDHIDQKDKRSQRWRTVSPRPKSRKTCRRPTYS